MNVKTLYKLMKKLAWRRCDNLLLKENLRGVKGEKNQCGFFCFHVSRLTFEKKKKKIKVLI